jgi:hypothetical protein
MLHQRVAVQNEEITLLHRLLITSQTPRESTIKRLATINHNRSTDQHTLFNPVVPRLPRRNLHNYGGTRIPSISVHSKLVCTENSSPLPLSLPTDRLYIPHWGSSSTPRRGHRLDISTLTLGEVVVPEVPVPSMMMEVARG